LFPCTTSSDLAPARVATGHHSRADVRCLVQHRTVEHFAAHAAGAVRSIARAAVPALDSPDRHTGAKVARSFCLRLQTKSAPCRALELIFRKDSPSPHSSTLSRFVQVYCPIIVPISSQNCPTISSLSRDNAEIT